MLDALSVGTVAKQTVQCINRVERK